VSRRRGRHAQRLQCPAFSVQGYLSLLTALRSRRPSAPSPTTKIRNGDATSWSRVDSRRRRGAHWRVGSARNRASSASGARVNENENENENEGSSLTARVGVQRIQSPWERCHQTPPVIPCHTIQVHRFPSAMHSAVSRKAEDSHGRVRRASSSLVRWDLYVAPTMELAVLVLSALFLPCAKFGCGTSHDSGIGRSPRPAAENGDSHRSTQTEIPFTASFLF
jgi:hypothetical protein